MEGWCLLLNFGIEGKTAVVTGGSRGVGREIALSLAREGTNVVLTYQDNKEKAKKVVERINKIGSRAVDLQLDLLDGNAVSKLIGKSSKHFGDIDILINNAATWPTSYIKDMSLREWKETIQINLDSVFLTCQAFVQHCLSKKKKGKILNITSQAAFYGSTTGHAHYAASKAGMIAFSISLAREHAKDGINVNNLALGIVDTDMMRESLQEKNDYYLNRIPLGRIAKPSEIADIASFLVSEKANYMTGATIDATGGMLMR